MHITRKAFLCLVFFFQTTHAWIHPNICNTGACTPSFSLSGSAPTYSPRASRSALATYMQKHAHVSTGSFNKFSHHGTLTLQTWYEGSSETSACHSSMSSKGTFGRAVYVADLLVHTHRHTPHLGELQQVITAGVRQTGHSIITMYPCGLWPQPWPQRCIFHGLRWKIQWATTN